MTDLNPLSPLLVKEAVEAALKEDLGRAGDITTDSIIPIDATMEAAIVARVEGCIAGTDFAKTSFQTMDPSAEITVYTVDGTFVSAGTEILRVKGNARAILTGERVGLNFMGHLSGIATATHKIVKAVEGTKARITCTRKTTPGLRAIEKYAVRAGGGFNHRFGLDDAVLIKDNHIAVMGGITPTIERARASIGHMVKIEIEVDTLDQLHEAVEAGADVILLDNMPPAVLKEAVTIIDGKAIAEASGGITAETAPAIAQSGVDILSIGWLTHSAPNMDLGLDFI